LPRSTARDTAKCIAAATGDRHFAGTAGKDSMASASALVVLSQAPMRVGAGWAVLALLALSACAPNERVIFVTVPARPPPAVIAGCETMPPTAFEDDPPPLRRLQYQETIVLTDPTPFSVMPEPTETVVVGGPAPTTSLWVGPGAYGGHGTRPFIGAHPHVGTGHVGAHPSVGHGTGHVGTGSLHVGGGSHGGGRGRGGGHGSGSHGGGRGRGGGRR
jgi:hypothetical protein